MQVQTGLPDLPLSGGTYKSLIGAGLFSPQRSTCAPCCFNIQNMTKDQFSLPQRVEETDYWTLSKIALLGNQSERCSRPGLGLCVAASSAIGAASRRATRDVETRQGVKNRAVYVASFTFLEVAARKQAKILHKVTKTCGACAQ